MSELAERLRAALAASEGSPVPLPGDMGWPPAPNAAPAAVLIAVTDTERPSLILTRRKDSMRSHAGQVAFPGGRIDPEDASPEAAALREAWEEIALEPAQAEIIGRITPYVTVTGFDVIPVLAIVPAGLPLHPNEDEVAELFEIPLDHALNPEHQIVEEREWQGRMRSYYVIDWPDQYIWGATAGMIVNLSKRLATL